MNILGIETSCDETAAAVVADGRRVRSNVIASQIELHRAHGGVVPELAARGHVTTIIPVVTAALAEAGIDRADVDVVAVTDGPGLAASLLVGVNVGKALAYGLARPLVTVNHLEAHVSANWLTPPGEDLLSPPRLPSVCLLVSGGHTELILITGHGHYQTLGRTLDDAAGEAVDKAARLLGLGYPGGPAMERAATGGDPTRFPLPRAILDEGYDFSFSGLKSALLRIVEPYRTADPPPVPEQRVAGAFLEHRPPRYRGDLPVADLAASYQQAVIDVLAVKTARAAEAFAAESVLLAGGVAANAALRRQVAVAVERQFAPRPAPLIRFPALALCTDNAAMVAGAAFYVLRRGGQAGWEADVHPRRGLRTED